MTLKVFTESVTELSFYSIFSVSVEKVIFLLFWLKFLTLLLIVTTKSTLLRDKAKPV